MAEELRAGRPGSEDPGAAGRILEAGGLRRRRRFRLITRGALIRLAVLALVLAALVFWGCHWMFRMPGQSYRGPLPPLSSEEAGLRDALRRHVERLAGEIGERNLRLPEKLAAAAAAVEAELRSAGYRVQDEEFEAEGRRCRNLRAELPGGDLAEEIVLVGAHYDSVGPGPGERRGSPGANDNASGVAALLEIARLLQGQSLRRTLRLVAFANEEPPFFQTAAMGSLVSARACRARGERLKAMLSLETMGYYRDEPGTQVYPAPFGAFYPDTANFIGFVGNIRSRKLVRDCVGAFRETTRFPCEGGAVFGWVTGVGWSDHWSFWEAGYPAVMVTDTAPFRYPYYHTAEDTPDKIDYDRLARVTAGLVRVIVRLAGGP